MESIHTMSRAHLTDCVHGLIVMKDRDPHELAEVLSTLRYHGAKVMEPRGVRHMGLSHVVLWEAWHILIDVPLGTRGHRVQSNIDDLGMYLDGVEPEVIGF